MRVCLVSQEYPPETAHGGIGSQNYNKARALSRLGHEVHVLSASGRNDGVEVRTEAHDGVTVHRIRSPESDLPLYNEVSFRIGYTWKVFRQLHDAMATHKFDVIDFADYGAEGFAYQLDRSVWNSVPVVVQLHGPLAIFAERIGWPERDSDLHRVGAFMEGVSIRHADALMACSANIADFTAAYYDVRRTEIHVVHCGVDAQMFSPPSDRVSARREPVILFVGDIAASKGVDTVFEAVLRVRARRPDVRLRILGKGDAATIGSMRARARQAGAEHKVEFAGFVSQRELMPEYYQNATVFCSPASNEPGVANVYIEAMACGCPVVASTTGGAPEAVIDGETGILVPPRNVEAVTAALEAVLDHRERGHQMGLAGRARVESYFTMDHYIQRVLATYQRAIKCSESKLKKCREAAGLS